MNILLADDSEYILDNLKKLIKPIPSVEHIFVAKDVKEANQLLDTEKLDVLVLDIKMPEGMGFDVLDKAKKKENPPIVIMLTNYDLDQYRKRSMHEGADYFFDKSTEFEKVIEVIENMDK